MMRARSWVILYGLVACGACSVSGVMYLPLDEEPATPEDCATSGDEDGNGMADCADPSCAGAPACMSTQPVCGDGHADPSEQCDDGNPINGDDCDTNCTTPRCGNGAVAPGEDCDDGNAINGDACDTNCTTPGCGNGAVDPDEDCDDGGATALCNGDCTQSRCGDGKLNLAAGEEVDPPASPSTVVQVNPQTCRYDFSAITQLSCAGRCGSWGGGNGCQKEDADAFCKLKTGDPNSTASAHTTGVAFAAAGICCPSADPQELDCVVLGTFAGRNVLQTVSVHDTNLELTHGPGAVITSATCTVP
jgi:cysteine-rich repeat protein